MDWIEIYCDTTFRNKIVLCSDQTKAQLVIEYILVKVKTRLSFMQWSVSTADIV